MSDARRLGSWGWFVRAFAAGFGTVCGLMAGAFLACIFYGIAAGGVSLFSSIGGGSVPQVYSATYPSPTVAPPTPYAAPYATPYAQCAPAPVGPSESSPYAQPAPVSIAEDVQYYPVAPATFAAPQAESDEGETSSEDDNEGEADCDSGSEKPGSEKPGEEEPNQDDS